MPASKTRKKSSGTSSVAEFKKKSGGLTELPSGLVVKLRNKGGMRGFLASGIIPNSLMGIVQDAIGKGTAPDMSGIVDDQGHMNEEMLNDMLLMTDRVVMDVMVDPVVLPAPTEADVEEWNRTHRAAKDKVKEPDDLRDDEELYIDEVDEEDKAFIFQWVTGGTRDVEQFRKELAAGMDDLGGLQSLPSAPQPTRGGRKR